MLAYHDTRFRVPRFHTDMEDIRFEFPTEVATGSGCKFVQVISLRVYEDHNVHIITLNSLMHGS